MTHVRELKEQAQRVREHWRARPKVTLSAEGAALLSMVENLPSPAVVISRATHESLQADNERLRGLIAKAETQGCKCGPAAENTGCPWCKAQLVFDGADRSPTDRRAVGYLPLEHDADCPAFSAPGVVR